MASLYLVSANNSFARVIRIRSISQAPLAGIAALVVGPAIYGLFQYYAADLHFLIQVAITFQLLLALMGLIRFWIPLNEPKRLPERKEIDLHTEPVVVFYGMAVIAAVVLLVVVFR